MQVLLSEFIMFKNRNAIVELASKKGLNVAFIVKHQILDYEIATMMRLKENKLYSTMKKYHNVVDMYSDENIVIVDAFEKREGISMEEASLIENKDTAIVNFYCCENKIPTEADLEWITDELKEMGYKTVSLGGSMLLEYDYEGYDEIRVGEAFLTGYSTVQGRYFEGLENPYSIKVDVHKKDIGRVIVKHGFLEIGGFTNAETICVNTDFTVIKDDGSLEYDLDGKLILKPDYYTLIKLAHNGDLKDVEYI